MNSRAFSASMMRDATPDAGRPRSPGAFHRSERASSDFGHVRVLLGVLALEAVRRRRALRVPHGAVHLVAHGAVHLALELAEGLLGLLPGAGPGPGAGEEPDTEHAQRPHAKQLHRLSSGGRILVNARQLNVPPRRSE